MRARFNKINKKSFKDKESFYVRIKPTAIKPDWDIFNISLNNITIAGHVVDVLRDSKCFVPEPTYRHGFSCVRIDVSVPYWMPNDELLELKDATRKLVDSLDGEIAKTYEELIGKDNG